MPAVTGEKTKVISAPKVEREVFERRHTIVNQLEELASQKKDCKAAQRLLVELANLI